MKRMKVDLHIHTKYSVDSNMEPGDLVKRAKELGFDAIGVTDHGTVKGALEAERIAKETAKDLIVFVGQEVNTEKGHVLVYNIKKEIREEQDLFKTCQEAKGNEGFLVVPHPFDLMRRGIGKSTENILEHVDAIEVFNARTIVNRFNEKAMEFAKENRIPAVAGSDAHFLSEFGKTYMLIESEKKESEILKAIKNRGAELVIQGPSMISGLRRGFRKVRTYF